MKREELKQEAIKKAYGEFYRACRPDENGWTDVWESVLFDELDESKIEIQYLNFDTSNTWRPKSISGIENNRGWIRIEEDLSNLPKEELDCFFIKDNLMYQGVWDNQLKGFYNGLQKIEATHYQPIIKPESPLY